MYKAWTSVAGCALGVACSVASAQWTVTYLNPPGVGESSAYGGDVGQQVGRTVTTTGFQHAAMWSGTAATWVNLHPAGATDSRALGVAEGVQVGQAYIGSVWQAGLWTGSAGSWVNLAPPGATESVAYGTADGRQVGYSVIGGVVRASMWSGTAASIVDLHPAGSSGSQINGTGGGLTRWAAVFDSSARGHLDRDSPVVAGPHPPGQTHSFANATDGVQQVGFTGHPLAARKRVDGHSRIVDKPAPRGSDAFLGIRRRRRHSGGVGLYRRRNACKRLERNGRVVARPSTFLVGSWGYTVATDVWIDGQTIFVSGYGHNLANGGEAALLWSALVPAPGALGLAGLAAIVACRRRR